MLKILIRSGTIITASETYIADILIEGERIVSIGQGIDAADAEIIDATGKIILPGGVDPHTHFDLPMFGTVSSDDHYTGHKAAAYGGTTTVIDFVPHDYPTLEESVDHWHGIADGKAAIDFSFHMNISSYTPAIAAELPNILDQGITSLKVFMAYNNRLRLDDGGIFRLMRQARELGMLVMLHAENGDVIDTLVSEAAGLGHLTPEWHALTRPAWGSVEAVLRGASLAAQSGAVLYVVHMNTTGEVDMLEYAREKGLAVMGETCPQYLFFTIEHLRRPDGAKWVCSPPVRSVEDNHRLWQGLADGTIQTIGTDHCPFYFDGTKPIEYEGQKIAIPGKELGKDDFRNIPNGLPGVGDRLPIMWTYGVRAGVITANQFVALVSTNPAKIFGLYPRKGTLIPGSDADIIIWDPEMRLTYGTAWSQQRTDYNLYEGWELVGFPEKVFLRGHLLVDKGQWYGRAGMGEFLRRKPSAEVI